MTKLADLLLKNGFKQFNYDYWFPMLGVQIPSKTQYEFVFDGLNFQVINPDAKHLPIVVKMWYDNSCDTTKLNSDLLIYENWLYDTSVNKLTLFADIANVLKSELPPRTKLVAITLLLRAYDFDHAKRIGFYNYLEQPTGNVFNAGGDSNRTIFYLIVRNYHWLMTEIERDTYTYHRVGMYERRNNY